MSKKRVYEIARERGLTSPQVMKRLEQAGITVKAAASTVSAEDEARVFGAAKERESAAPSAGKGLPSWLSPSASSGPRTTSKAALDAEREKRNAKADAAKAAKAKAQEQARALRAQLAAKKAQQEAAADAARQIADEIPAAAAAQEAADAGSAPAAASEPAAEPAPAVAEPEASEAVADSDASSAGADADAPPAAPAAAPADEVADSDEDSRVGPKILKRADPAEVAKAAAPEPAPTPAEPAVPAAQAAADAAEAEALSEADLRRRAQKMAQQRVAELAARRRAEIEREKLEAEQRKRDEAKGDKTKKKDKKKGDEAASNEPEFIGSRKPRVGGASRADVDRGGRGGPNKRRRVVIDGGAGRGRGGQGGGRGRGGRKYRKQEAEVVIDPTVPVTVPAGASVKELADALHVGSTEVIKALMEAGEMVTITQTLTAEQIETVGIALDPPREIIVKSAADEDVIPEFDDPEETLVTRAPVVTIMGHVDHGKTSLLDAIRETKVASGEAGGITQHIGAYQVEVPGEHGPRKVTFLDTPGHEAFTALRARGAKVTDEAVLVVAADDGVKPQTIEAMDHAKAAEVPIIVAINKIDKENAQPDKVMSELAQHELQPVEWGGDTEVVQVSAKQRTNLDDLIEMILLQADVLELKANPDAEASGYVIESKLDPGRGPVATILISRGTLKVGDAVVAGQTHGKVRALLDFKGERIKEAGPAVPVEIVGFDAVPDAGEFCMVVENERVAREKAQKKALRLKAELLAKRQRGLTLDSLFARIKDGEMQDLNLIIKTDVAGSAEAIEQELGKIQHDEVRVRVIRAAVGAITKDDIMLASASSAIIVGFNVRANAEVREVANKEGVDVRSYRVIYKLREDIEAALSGMLSPEEVEKTTGEAEVRQVFKASRIGTIAGCMVSSGTITRGSKVRLLRDGAIIHEGEVSGLKRFKDDVREVQQGFECGISLDTFNDIKEGDVFETYVIEEVERDITSELTSKS